MKTFTAKELNKKPAQVFRAADQEGSVRINHDRYPDKVFIIEGRVRRTGCEHDCDEDMICIKCGEQCATFGPFNHTPQYKISLQSENKE